MEQLALFVLPQNCDSTEPEDDSSEDSAASKVAVIPTGQVTRKLKCVCDSQEIAGNEIYCISCETWQHVECYYSDRAEKLLAPELDHTCVDCSLSNHDLKQVQLRDSSSHQERDGSSLGKTDLGLNQTQKNPSNIYQAGGVYKLRKTENKLGTDYRQMIESCDYSWTCCQCGIRIVKTIYSNSSPVCPNTDSCGHWKCDDCPIKRIAIRRVG